MLAAHWLCDARLTLAAMDLLLRNIRDELTGSAAYIGSLKWGEEVERLPSATVNLMDDYIFASSASTSAISGGSESSWPCMF